MKTLEEIKDEVAKEIVGSDNPIVTWKALSVLGLTAGVDLVAKKYAQEVAKQALNDAAENAKITEYPCMGGSTYKINRNSIINTPIILI